MLEEGSGVGACDGEDDGNGVVGIGVGPLDGLEDGSGVGELLEGAGDGTAEGEAVGSGEGSMVGAKVGGTHSRPNLLFLAILKS